MAVLAWLAKVGGGVAHPNAQPSNKEPKDAVCQLDLVRIRAAKVVDKRRLQTKRLRAALNSRAIRAIKRLATACKKPENPACVA